MFLVILSVCLSIMAVAFLLIMTIGNRTSKRVQSRLDALDQEYTPPVREEAATDIRKEQKKLSAIPLLNHWLIKLNLATKTSLFLYQAGVTSTLGSLILMSVVGAIAIGYMLYLRSGDVLPSLILACVFLPLPLTYVRRRRTKRLAKLEAQLAEALSMMASALRVGHSFAAALGAVAQECPEPIGGEMRKCFEEQNFGIDLRTSLTNLTKRIPVQDFRIFVAAVLIQRESGGNLAEVLDKVVQTSRERFRLKKQVSVHTAQGRLTGWVLSFMPLALGSLMYLMNPSGMSILWTSNIGLKLLYGASGMNVLGMLIIRKIVKINV
jgi:tight adherence protein B